MRTSSTAAAAAAVAVTALVGTAGADVRSGWYRRLDKPWWQPPAPVLGAAWTTLHVVLALAGGGALGQRRG